MFFFLEIGDEKYSRYKYKVKLNKSLVLMLYGMFLEFYSVLER